MKALVLTEPHKIALQEVDRPGTVGPTDVRISVHTVGICGSDMHYVEHGRIGNFVVKEPMVLGHEASGVVTEVGAEVTHLSVGDRVAMEPGIPDLSSRAAKEGHYNVDPSVRFWATPPIDGCLAEEVIHPAAFTYRLPDEVSFAEGALIEPFAVAVHSVSKANLTPGSVVAVSGAGTIGVLTAMAALAGGASRVFISDIATEKFAKVEHDRRIIPVNVAEQSLSDAVLAATDGWGADAVFEASGAQASYADLARAAAPAATLVMIGMPTGDITLDLVALQAKELRIETIFRYANAYPRAIELAASPAVDLASLVSATFSFEEAVEAFARGAEARPTDTKIQIQVAS